MQRHFEETMTPDSKPTTVRRQPVAVFDYDGTCISGQSGALIATWLLRGGYLSARTALGLSWWGLRYKWHLPYRHEEARELIFSDLGSRSHDDVRQIMEQFHDEVLLPRYRQNAMREIAYRKAEGCAVVLASATFKAIARKAAEHLGADGFVATEMERDEQGRYTGRVMGDVIEGEHKVELVRTWANEHLGEDAWYLAYAYGDHHTDIELLLAAEHPFAVSAGPTLRRRAKREGWPQLSWKET